ncbi:MAG TPA: hypothetical protein P5137_16600, partial [Candidatus Brocadiia bacterium]|nr:hypothetical protein [Candidatus Brocadiia bacterium]
MRTPGFAFLAALLWAGACAAANLTPWGDCESGGPDGRPAQFWHRAGGQYLSAWPDWKLTQDQKAAGRQSVTTDTDREFVVCGETEGGWIAGSVWLRAEKPGVKVVLRLSWYDRLNRADTVETVEAGPQWKQHTLKAEALRGEPVEIAVRAEKPGVRIWADNFVIEGAPVADQFTDKVYVYAKGETEEKTSQIGVVRGKPVDLSKLQAWAGQAADTPGRLSLSVDVPANAAELPCVTGGVPLPRGKLFRREHARLVDGAGREAPAQFDVLSRWPADGSIMMLLVTTPTPAKSSRLWLEFGPAVQAAVVTDPLDPRASEKLPIPAPRVLGADGQAIEAAGQSARVEMAGPLRSVWAVEGRLNKAGRFVTRVITWRGSKRYYVAGQWLNDEKSSSIPVRAACLAGFPAPAGQQPSLLTQAALDQRFFTSAGPVARPPAGEPKRDNGLFGGSLAVRDFWRNHPMAVEARPKAFTVWLWPHTVQGVLIPQGFGKQWEFLVDPDGRLTQPLLTENMPLLRADAEWMCGSGVFEFIMPPDPARFPIFEQRVGSAKTLGNFALDAKESRNLYGVFNFGDAPGDGGWANLESMADHELFLHWMRTGSREHFDMARLAAEHYRDMDIHHGAGFAHTHCNNHVASNESWSHA